MNNPLDNTLILIIGMGIVSYFAREIPFIVLKNRKLNSNIIEWMSFIPVSVLSALLIPDLIIVDNRLNISFNNTILIGGILTIIFSLYIKNLFAVIIFGIFIVAIMRYFTV